MSTIVYVEHAKEEGEADIVVEEDGKATMTLNMTIVDLLQLAGRCMEVANEYFSKASEPTDEELGSIKPFGEV